jgi:acetoin utilization deacetylase AcuC-like enzyme
MTLLVTDGLYRKHRAPNHPECPERLAAIEEHLHACGLWDRVTHLPARDATDEELGLVHTAEHVARIRAMKPGWIDEDTYVNEHSLAAALRAAGGVVAACDAVAAGRDSTAFCLVRPPGHHATSDRAMGFCLFNNVAIAARKLRRRVLIVDWDVHHGNGTQKIFESDPTVFYLSTHRYPFYPGTGAASEHGRGNVLNIPLEMGTSREEVLREFEEGVRSAAAGFRPEFVLISCGFDAYEKDPVGGLSLRPEDFGEMTRILRSLKVPVVSALEGGYALDALGRCAEAHLEALMQ